MIKMGKDREFWILVSGILAILFLASMTYIIVSKYREARIERENELIQLGAQQGYEYAISQIMQQASECKPVNIHANNQTISLVDIECVDFSK